MSPARLGVKIVVENQRANNSFRKCGCRQVRMYDPSMIGISHGTIFSPINASIQTTCVLSVCEPKTAHAEAGICLLSCI